MGLQPSALPEKVSRVWWAQRWQTLQHNQRLRAEHFMIKTAKPVFIKVSHLFNLTPRLLPSQPKSSLSSSFRLQIHTKTQTCTNWLWTGVNHGPFERIAGLNTLPPTKSPLLNKGVKRCFCLPSFWRRWEAWKTQMNMKIGTKCQTHNGNAGHLICVPGN